MHLTDIDPPNGYTISGEGQGGVAGFAKGGAKVRLDDDGSGTLLSYEVHAQVGGKIAQLGARLIDAIAPSRWRTPSSTGSAREVAPPAAPLPPRSSSRSAAAARRHRRRRRRSARSRWCRASRSACRSSPGSAA